MLSGYYTIAISQQSLFYIHTDYQYITILIKQRIQLYYNNLHTIIWYRLICNICKSGCHSSIQHKTFNIEYLNYRPITKYQALHSHDIQLCIQVCHKQTDIYIFHQVNTTLFYSYKWAWSHNPLKVDFCSNEQSKLCLCPTEYFLSDKDLFGLFLNLRVSFFVRN